MDERRMAMSRRHIAPDGGGDPYVDWLKSLGCIVYLPLREDLVERISGISCVPTGDGSYYFQDGYCFITTPSYSIATVLNLTLPDLKNNVRQDYTLLGETAAISLSVAKNTCRPTLFSNQAIDSEYPPQYLGSFMWSSIPKDYALYKAARVYVHSTHTTTYYSNGDYYNSSTNFNIDITSMSFPYRDGFTIGCAGHNNFRSCTFKMRDFMMFDSALSLQTIKQIQGIS